MRELSLGQAVDRAIEDAMVRDESIILMGEDAPMLRAPLFARFGADRVLATPISEAAFFGAAAGAAMAGLRPVVELYMVDFIAVALDSVLNHIAKLETFSGGAWKAPLVIRAPTGAGYGDGGQHGQALWGSLASIPGLSVVVASTPADAYGLMTTALAHDGPVIFMEPKLLSEEWLEFLGRGGRDTVTFDIPAAGRIGKVPDPPHVTPFGTAAVRREGSDITVASLAVGVHRALEAANRLSDQGIDCEVIDLRSLRPLDVPTVVASVDKTGRLLVVDEDYRNFGLSGELAAVSLEAGLSPRFGRVCVEDTLPFARHLENEALPNVDRIITAATALVSS
jgi:pyruvate/2-oxoglutarate/acetoin dehydrogenase E1 component